MAHQYLAVRVEGLQRTPFSSARALRVSAEPEGLSEPQPAYSVYNGPYCRTIVRLYISESVQS